MEQDITSRCGVCGMLCEAQRLNGHTRAIAKSPGMQSLFKRAARFALSEAPVLILGETGSGKEVVARILHKNSPRAEKPFVAINVAALPAQLLESELFGHGKGAFTGAEQKRVGLVEAAHGGVLFLDEIGEMPEDLQVKLLRVLQDGEVRRVGENETFAVDVRVVCATHRDLIERVADGRFREDLYYRLKVLTLRVPPLRDRVQDILPLTHEFLTRLKSKLKGPNPEAEACMLAYSWPGNVRELENAMRHAAALAAGPTFEVEDLPEEVQEDLPNSETPNPRRTDETLPTLAEVEQAHILKVLDACQGSQTEAAQVLGIARNTLWRKLRTIAKAELL